MIESPWLYVAMVCQVQAEDSLNQEGDLLGFQLDGISSNYERTDPQISAILASSTLLAPTAVFYFSLDVLWTAVCEFRSGVSLVESHHPGPLVGCDITTVRLPYSRVNSPQRLPFGIRPKILRFGLPATLHPRSVSRVRQVPVLFVNLVFLL